MYRALNSNIIREITPLTSNDCFTIVSREKDEFDYPLHYHDEYELTLILNGKGAKRVVGNSIGILDDAELVFIGPNLYHAWFTHQCASQTIQMITIQFHRDLFEETFLRKNQLSLIRNLLNNAKRGMLFPKETVQNTIARIINLKQKSQFEAVLELFSIFHTLSISTNVKLLSDLTFSGERLSYKSRRIEKVFEYMNANYDKHITLAQVAEVANMPAISFSRFIKKRTGKTFIESLNEVRLGHASRMLINTGLNISEIAYKCGFNNISNFNRIFKHAKMCIPTEFRKTYINEQRVYI